MEPSQKARFLASLAPHSGDWLLVLPIANCGLRLDDEAVHVAVSMRLGLSLCIPHSCPCGEQVDDQGLHATVCKKAPGRIARHQVLNDIIWRSMGAAGIPDTKKPSGLVRQDGKRPNRLTLIPWQGGKSLAWDVTVVSTLAQSYVDRAATGVRAVAEMAAERKLAKYSNLASNFTIQPIAVDHLGPFSLSTLEFLCDLGHKLNSFSGEEQASSFLFQRLSVSLQRFNSVLLHDTFVIDDVPDQ